MMVMRINWEENSIIPVCLRWCLFNWSERENPRPQSGKLHRYGFSPAKGIVHIIVTTSPQDLKVSLVDHPPSQKMWADFIKLEEFDALSYKAEHHKSILKSDCSTEARNQCSSGAGFTHSHLCVYGHASADGTAWSTSCCSQDEHIRTDASRWPLTSYQLVERYQEPAEHP